MRLSQLRGFDARGYLVHKNNLKKRIGKIVISSVHLLYRANEPTYTGKLTNLGYVLIGNNSPVSTSIVLLNENT